MKHLWNFLRSVLPEDLTQLLFLGGVVCLVVSPHLRWLPPGLMTAAGEHRADVHFVRAWTLISLAMWPLILAGISGYLICFRPGRRTVQRILYLVFLPAITGAGLIYSQIFALNQTTSSVLEAKRTLIPNSEIWRLTGFHFWLAGLFLAAIYTSRLVLGVARLPLSLRSNASIQTGDLEDWRHLQFLIWVLVGPLFILYSLFSFVTMILPTILLSRWLPYIHSAWFSQVSRVAEAFLVFAILVWIMGKENWQVMWSTAKLPEPRYVALGLAFPVGIAILLSTGQYLVERALWAHGLGESLPPQFGSYFSLPDPWLLLLFFSALFEEMIFRGLLQHRLIQRYGVYRGIFLVGIVWAAFHFAWDFSLSRSTDSEVLLRLGWRIFFCLALGYVLGWLTLRFDSILPAAVAHTLYNVLVVSAFGKPFLGKDTVLVVLWGVLAWALFRYWPVQVRNEPDSNAPVASPEPAL